MMVRGGVGLIVFAVFCVCALSAQVTAVDATALLRSATQNRLDGLAHHQPQRYLLRRIDGSYSTTKDVIETRGGEVERLIAINGRPLTAEQDQAELSRLTSLLKHPELQEERRTSEQKNRAREVRMTRLLPRALLYEFVEMTPCFGGECYRVSFSPNPRFKPPNMEANVFRGLAGEAWIDQAQGRLTRVDARLVSNVGFGWGIFGKLDKGGTLSMEETQVGEHEWAMTWLKIEMKGRAMILKHLTFQFTEEMSQFSQVSADLGWREAIGILEQTVPPDAKPDLQSGP